MTDKKEKDVLMDHDYDGIQELDNDLPSWWLWLFYISIVWAVIYLLYYHVLGIGDSSAVEYMKEVDPAWEQTPQAATFSIGYHSPFYTSGEDLTPLTRAEHAIAWEKEKSVRLAEKRATGEAGIELTDLSFNDIIKAAMRVASAEELEKLKTVFPGIWNSYQKETEGIVETAVVEESVPETIIKPLNDPESLASGESIFLTNCATCHGKLGEGGIGPNLTDEYFLHGSTMNDYVKVITSGVAAKGMISWRGILKEQQILEVASYILSLRGTNPPNAKAPQGEKVELAVQE